MMRRNQVMILLAVLFGVIILSSVCAGAWCGLEGFEGGERKPTFVLFHMPGCPHCRRMMGAWDGLMRRYRGVPEIQVVKISSDEYPKLMKLYNVQSYPTMRFYPEGMANKNNYQSYDGDRTEEAMNNYIEGVMSKSPDMAKPLNQPEPPSRPSGYPFKPFSAVANAMNLN